MADAEVKSKNSLGHRARLFLLLSISLNGYFLSVEEKAGECTQPQTFGEKHGTKLLALLGLVQPCKITRNFVFYSPISQLPLFFESLTAPARALREKEFSAVDSGPGGVGCCHAMSIE
ncbi:hypothetical protein [Hymenobacter agri]